VKEDGRAVALFHSTSHAIKAERLLKKESINCDMIPVPRHLSSDCGVCIRFARSDKDAVIGILGQSDIFFEGPVDI
jgi:hypothetical protein